MGFSSMDDLVNEMTTNSKFRRVDFNKLTHAVTTQVAGEWYSLFHSTGNPAAGVLNGGTSKVFQTLDETSTGAIPHGGTVSPDTKHILNASAFSAGATTMPAVLMLVDLLGYIPLLNTGSPNPITTGASTDLELIMGEVNAANNGLTITADSGSDVITHTGGDVATFTRVRVSNSGGGLPGNLSGGTDYWTVRQSATTSKLATSRANAVANSTIDISSNGTGTNTMFLLLPRSTTGAGVQTFYTPTTVMGGATPNIKNTYTNAAGTAAKVTPTTLPVGKTAAPIGIVEYSGTGAGKYGPFMPLAAGDTGTRDVYKMSLSTSYLSGAHACVFAKPLLTLPLTTIGVAAERDLLNQVPSLPPIEDGACLSWLLYAGAATPTSSPFFGHLDFAWG
jgi:hypothetical protein